MIKWIVVSSESVFLLFRALLLFLVFDVSSFSAVVLLIKSLIFCQIKSSERFLEKSRKNFGKVPRDFGKSSERFLRKERPLFETLFGRLGWDGVYNV